MNFLDTYSLSQEMVDRLMEEQNVFQMKWIQNEETICIEICPFQDNLWIHVYL